MTPTPRTPKATEESPSAAASRYQQLRSHLAELKLAAAAEALPAVLDQATAEGLSLTVALERLLTVEVEASTARRLAGRLRLACLPTPATLADFDVDSAALVDEVGRVALPTGQCASLGLQLAVDALGGAGEGDEPVAFDRCLPVDGVLGLGHLFIDTVQTAPGPILTKLVVDDPIEDAAGLLATGGRPRLGQHELIGHRLRGVCGVPFADDVGQERDAGAQDVGLRSSRLSRKVSGEA